MGDDDYISNNEEILGRIASCVSLNGGPVGSSLSVGFYEDGALNKLKNIIIRAIQQRKTTVEEENNSNNINNINNNITTITKQQAEFNVKKIFERLVKDLNDENKGILKSLRNFGDKVLKEFPKTHLILNSILAVGKTQLSQGIKQVEVYKNLVNSGVNLQQTTKSLYLNANKVGLTYDNYIKVLQKNSETYAKLNGIYKNGHTVFDKMVRSAKDVTKELGLDFSTSIKISNDFMKENAFYYEMHGKSMETLIDESKSYAKSLVGLSKATGKSTESIYSEIKAREKDNLWRVLNADPRNKGLIAAMQASGFSTEMMEGILTGTWNVQLGQASTAPGFSKIIDYLNYIKTQGLDLDSNEILKGMKGALTPYASDISIMEKMMRENLPVTAALRDFGGITGNLISTNILQSNFQKGNKEDQEGFQHYANFEEQLDILNNNIALTLTPALEDFGNAISFATFALEKTNKFIEPIANFLSKHPYLSMFGAGAGMGLGNLLVNKLLGGINLRGLSLSGLNPFNRMSNKELSAFMNYGANYGQDRLDEYIRRYRRYKRRKYVTDAWDTTKRFGGAAWDTTKRASGAAWSGIKTVGGALGRGAMMLLSNPWGWVALITIALTTLIVKFRHQIFYFIKTTFYKFKDSLSDAYKWYNNLWKKFFNSIAYGFEKMIAAIKHKIPFIGTSDEEYEKELASLKKKHVTDFQKKLKDEDKAIAEERKKRDDRLKKELDDAVNKDKLKQNKSNKEQKNTKQLEDINESVKTYCNVSNSPMLKTLVDINKDLLSNVKMINFHVTRLSKDFIGENLSEGDIESFNAIFKTKYKLGNKNKFDNDEKRETYLMEKFSSSSSMKDVQTTNMFYNKENMYFNEKNWENLNVIKENTSYVKLIYGLMVKRFLDDEKRKIFNQAFGSLSLSSFVENFSLNSPEFLIRQFRNTMGKNIDMEKMKTFSDVVGINSYNKFERTLEKMNEIMTKQEKSNKDISYYLQSIDANTNSTAKSTKKYANEGINLDVYDF